MLLGIIAILGLLFFQNLYDLNLFLYRKWGWKTLADTWERRKKWGLFTGRIILSAIAIAALVVLYLS